MDPLQVLKDCAEAVGFEDYGQALELLLRYLHWRLKGGFQPTNINGRSGDDYAETLGNQILEGIQKMESRK